MCIRDRPPCNFTTADISTTGTEVVAFRDNECVYAKICYALTNKFVEQINNFTQLQ